MIYQKRVYTELNTLRIGVYPFVMYLTKHSCLTTEINNKIEYVVTSGLIDKWTAEYKRTRFLDLDKNIPHTLNIMQLSGVFQLCALFLVAAFILFIFEIIIN